VPSGLGDDVPDEVVERAKAAFAGRRGGELATLVFDSVLEDAAPSPDRRLRFGHPLVTIMLDISPVDGWCRLEGRVAVAGGWTRVELHQELGGIGLVSEIDAGVFVFERLPRTLMCLELLGPDDLTPVRTDWFIP